MRKKLAALLKAHGEVEQTHQPLGREPGQPSATPHPAAPEFLPVG
jgi:hypothetical protein